MALAVEQALTCLLFVDTRSSCAQCYQAGGIRGYRVTRKDPSRILRGCSEVQKYYGDTPRKAFESHTGEQVAKDDKNAMLLLNHTGAPFAAPALSDLIAGLL